MQNRSINITNCTSASLTSNTHRPNAPHPHQDPPAPACSASIPLVNNRKGSLLPLGPGPRANPSLLRLSISGPGNGPGRGLAESRLNRARSLPVKYRYHPSNAPLLGRSRPRRLPPLSGMHQSVTPSPRPPLSCPVLPHCAVCMRVRHTLSCH